MLRVINADFKKKKKTVGALHQMEGAGVRARTRIKSWASISKLELGWGHHDHDR
jgi:ribosomal protein S13